MSSQMLKIEVLHSRKEGTSLDDFIKNASDMMRDAAPIMKKHGVVHFSVVGRAW
jgi:hypothetical protein